ncbi:hypothetical protein [Dactylosporangium sp. CA-233914]|uniref:hypothetical protein n=1 Tax=Dactylosporangium sp. CA-233914 TaxID=3239934 RepID=UPI003D923A8A
MTGRGQPGSPHFGTVKAAARDADLSVVVRAAIPGRNGITKIVTFQEDSMRTRRILVSVVAAAAVLVAGTVTGSAYADESISAAATDNGLVLAGPTGPAATTKPPTTTPPMRLTSGSVPLPSNRVIRLTKDFSGAGYDKNAIKKIVSAAKSKGVGVYMQQTLAALPAHVPYPERFENTDFNGAISMDGSKLTLTITKGEVTTQVNWWQTTIANAVAFIALLTTFAACTAALPETTPTGFCGGMAGGLGELTKSVILQAFDGKLADKEEWGNTIVNVLVAMGLGAFGENALKWAKTEIPAVIKSIAKSTREFGTKLSAAWGAIRGVVINSGDYLTGLAPFVQRALSRAIA